jgi:hypothetical protein
MFLPHSMGAPFKLCLGGDFSALSYIDCCLLETRERDTAYW